MAGKLWTDIEIELNDKDIRQKDHDMQFDYRQFGGDSAEDLKNRVVKFIEETKAKYPDKKILVTTHGGVIDTMHKLYTQDATMGSDNATVHEFTF